MRPFGRPPYFMFYCTLALGKHKPINVKPALSLQLPDLCREKPWMREYLAIPYDKVESSLKTRTPKLREPHQLTL